MEYLVTGDELAQPERDPEMDEFCRKLERLPREKRVQLLGYLDRLAEEPPSKHTGESQARGA